MNVKTLSDLFKEVYGDKIQDLILNNPFGLDEKNRKIYKKKIQFKEELEKIKKEVKDEKD